MKKPLRVQLSRKHSPNAPYDWILCNRLTSSASKTTHQTPSVFVRPTRSLTASKKADKLKKALCSLYSHANAVYSKPTAKTRSLALNSTEHTLGRGSFGTVTLTQNSYGMICACKSNYHEGASGYEWYDVGTTRIYFKGGVLEELENYRSEALTKSAITIQRYLRGHLRKRIFVLCRR